MSTSSKRGVLWRREISKFPPCKGKFKAIKLDPSGESSGSFLKIPVEGYLDIFSGNHFFTDGESPYEPITMVCSPSSSLFSMNRGNNLLLNSVSKSFYLEKVISSHIPGSAGFL